ncbi:MAG: DUF2914 domain-containing protein [Polyangiaceae bacterium]|nr:DUF2914 domain-containing protein [Myxococcales bacterium]MCB9586870.1 DUF2914 domain-containing protein [Polyangiaceae bacterium]MCB9608158.1 DUF2914 domain-containing protein [Polyangiaceae bacterium]
MTSVTPIQSVLRKSVLGLGLCALMATMAGCGRDTHAEPDPAKVSVEINPAKPGLNKPLALPQENKDDSSIVAEPARDLAAKSNPDSVKPSDDTQPASAQGPSAKDPSASDTKPADVKSSAAVPLRIKRLVVTTEIDKREPVEVSSFEAGSGPIYAFMELENPADEQQDVLVTFIHSSGRKVGLVELHIPAKQRRWRTWGRTQNIKQGGEWEAIVTDADGHELARTKFQVSETKSAEKPAALPTSAK